jgi:DNA-binding CsgD family transcriptional regulator
MTKAVSIACRKKPIQLGIETSCAYRIPVGSMNSLWGSLRKFLNKTSDAIRAIGTEAFCPNLHEALSEAFDFDNFLVIAYFGDNNPIAIYRKSRSSIVYAGMDDLYVPSLYVLDPFYTAHMSRVPAGLYRLRNLAPDKFRTTSYFQRYYERTTLLDELAYFGYTRTGWTINVCVGRDATSGRLFDRSSLSRARDVEGIMVALIEMQWSEFRNSEAPAISGQETLIPRLIAELKEREGISITRRQAEVAVFILRGHSSHSIALNLGISWQTVKVFRRQLYTRCGITSQAELFSLMLPMLR